MVENSSAAVLAISATVSNGTPASYEIAGGDDAAKFKLGADGALSFITAPNYDEFADADEDNIYLVAVRASGGGASKVQTIEVKVTNDREGVAVKRLATGLGADPVFASYNRADAAMVVSQDGKIVLVDTATGGLTDFGETFATGETGRIMAASFFNNAAIVMVDSDTAGIYLQLVPPPGGTRYSRRAIQLAPVASLEPRGAMFRGNNGQLYAALGDPSGNWAQDAGSGYGKLFSVVLDPGCGASVYTFCFTAAVVGDGIRAPGGGVRHLASTLLFDQASVGEEEVTSFDVDARPLDFGWPYRQGTQALIQNPPAAVNGPFIVYPHGTGFREGQGIIGGAVYQGEIASLNDMLVFADVAGRIWTAPASFLSDGALHTVRQFEIRTEDFAPDAGKIDSPAGVILDRTGRIVILDSDGEIFAVQPG